MNNLPPGTIVDDRYELLNSLGEGGMGTVYKARELGLERTVALKMLQPGLLGDEEQRLRFNREGKILSELSHHNLIVVYRLGIWEKMYPYIAMEYIQGTSLRAAIDAGKVPVERCIKIAQQACEGMESAHRAGIVHRDLKPDNIMLLDEPEQDFVKVLDFGLARVLSDSGKMSQHLTQTGALVGSVYYMSPEQCMGKKADNRSDIYALGCIMFEALTGSPPFSADNPIGLMHKHTFEPIPPLPRGNELPPGLESVLVKAMDKDPDQRYQSMIELQADLALVYTGKGGEIPPVKPTKRSRRGLLVLTTGLALISIVIGGIFWRRAPQSTVNLHREFHKFEPRVQITDHKAALRRAYGATDATVGDSRSEAERKLLALAQAERGLINRIPEPDRPLKMQAHLALSWVYRRLFYVTSDDHCLVLAKEECEKALLYATPSEGAPLRAAGSVYMSLGEIACEQKDGKSALVNFERALHIISNTAPSERFVLDSQLPGQQADDVVSYLEVRIGNLAASLGNEKLAEKSFRHAIECRRGIRLVSNHSIEAIEPLAKLLKQRNSNNEVHKYLTETEREIRRENDAALIKSDHAAAFFSTLARAAIVTGDLNDGLRLMLEALRNVDAIADATIFVNIDSSLGMLGEAAISAHREDIVLKTNQMKERLYQHRARSK